jgi:hypothetical protein
VKIELRFFTASVAALPFPFSSYSSAAWFECSDHSADAGHSQILAATGFCCAAVAVPFLKATGDDDPSRMGDGFTALPRNAFVTSDKRN